VRAVLTILLVVCAGSPAFADDASAVWRKVLGNCAKTAAIGEQSLFFGLSNTVGPGSVWRFADDKSVRLLFELEEAFPGEAERATLVKENNVAACVGASSTKWNLKFGLPFTTRAVAVDLSALLGSAKSVTVSITGWAVDELRETAWKEAFRKLRSSDAGNPYVQELGQAQRILAMNTVKVTGLKATFTYGANLSAEARATVRGRTVPVDGEPTSQAPDAAKSGTGGASTAPASSTAKPPAVQQAESRGATPQAAGPCGASPTIKSASGGAPTATGRQAAVLAFDLVSDNQIVVCAEGPFYLVAAFSRLVGGKPIGMTSAENVPLVLVPAAIPSGRVARTERSGQ